MSYDLDQLWVARWLLARGVAAVYLLAFLAVVHQGRALLGERGLQPMRRFLARARFREAPSLFHLAASDRLLVAVGWTGAALAAASLLGLLDRGPLWLPLVGGLALWALYLSVVNVGQTFYAFGWESMLLEAGFFAAFLGPAWSRPSAIPVLCLRWMLFRVELGAGLIKLRHDSCWRDLTCLEYHHETQPLPNPLSWWFHRLPRPLHRAGVLYSHLVQLVVPFGLLAPQPLAGIAGALLVSHQLLLIASGNYAWLNGLTVVLGAAAVSDRWLAPALGLEVPATAPRPFAWDAVLAALAAVTAWLSVAPVRNLFSSAQLMNFSYNPLHLVNTYGAFGSVSRERFEVVIEGSDDARPTEAGAWRAYENRAKPGDPRRRPPQVAPYHLRLDWLLWFLPLRALVDRDGSVAVPGYERWFLTLLRRLLEGDRTVLALFRANPFPLAPPRFVRVRFYRYRFTDRRERRETGAWWSRTLLGEYLPPLSRADLERLAP